MNLCYNCSKIQKTCCQFTDIILTDNDIKRIKGLGFNDFVEYREPLSPDNEFEDDPNWILYTINSSKKMQLAKRHENGDCFFLSDKGCSISLEERPLLCRLYPYYYNENSIVKIYPYHCPKDWVKSHDHSLLEREFSLSKENAVKWHSDFYNELKEGIIFYENRNNLRSQG